MTRQVNLEPEARYDCFWSCDGESKCPNTITIKGHHGTWSTKKENQHLRNLGWFTEGANIHYCPECYVKRWFLDDLDEEEE